MSIFHIFCKQIFLRLKLNMSIYYSGAFSRSGGIYSAITKQLKMVNLKPVKKIQVQFDPFHPNAVTARDFLFHISKPKVLETNISCIIKTNVVCDRSEPEIKIDLGDKRIIKFLANNLTVLEVLQQFNKHISSKVPQDTLSSPATAKLEAKKKSRR